MTGVLWSYYDAVDCGGRAYSYGDNDKYILTNDKH